MDPITGNRSESLDAGCAAMFGQQDVGAWRSQVLTSLGGKILRVAPDSGDGICNGSNTGDLDITTLDAQGARALYP